MIRQTPVNSPSQSRASTHDGTVLMLIPFRFARVGVVSRSVVEIWCSFSEAYSKGLTCCVVGAPTRSPLGPAWGAPRPPEVGGLTPPLRAPSSPALPNAIDCRAESEAGSPPSATKPCLPIPCESFAGRPTRVRPCSPPLPPGPDTPSTRAVLATRLGVTRMRKGGTRAPLPLTFFVK